jgi:hypothetical protein
MGVVEMRGMRNPIQIRRFHLVSMLLVGAVLVGGIGIASGATGTSPSSQPPFSEARNLATGPDAASVAAFSIMRRPRTSGDDLSSRVIGGLSIASGANMALSRRAYGFADGEAWVIPGIGNVCLWAESTTASNGGATCSGDATATAGHVMFQATSPSAPGKVFIAGLVPDGVSSVTATLVDNTSVVLPVHENVYMQEIGGKVQSVSVGGSKVEVAAQ